MSHASAFETNGRDAFVLNWLEQGADTNLGSEWGVQVYLDTKTSVSTSDVIDGTSIDLQ